MSSRLDEDTARAVSSLQETAGGMLSTAQRHLQKAFVVFVVGLVATLVALRVVVWPALKSHLLGTLPPAVRAQTRIVAVTPFEVILLQVKLGVLFGLLLALPVVGYYSRDALRGRGWWPTRRFERWKKLTVGTVALALFVGGIAYAYYFFFPLLFQFLATNAVRSGFVPTYSITKWTQFIFIVSLALGAATELPLVMSTLSYLGVVTHETFKGYWRHAVLAIVVIAAVVNGSPDPFSMTIIALPMITLYGVGLVCTAILSRLRASGVDIGAAETDAEAESGTGATGTEGETSDQSRDERSASVGDPAEIDIDALSAQAVRAAPPEAFEDLSENEALEHAERAMEEGNREKAELVLERFDEAGAGRDGSREAVDEDAASESDPVTSTAAGMVDAFTEDDTTEDDIGGYYYDVRFILDSLTSKAIWIVGVFVAVMTATFAYLYRGGIGAIKRAFLDSMPPRLADDVEIVVLHPVEALIFEMKFAALLGLLATLPVVAYFAWPAIEARDITSGDRSVLLVWGGTLLVALVVGSLVGFFYVAPRVIGWLATDALNSGMIIAYRVSKFGWLVFFTTVGVGLLLELPVTMLLFHRGDIVSYSTMRRRWRVVVLGFFVLGSALSPRGVFTMFIVALPASFAYGVGLGVLWLYASLTRQSSASARPSGG